jgi:hypothetical protein
MLIHALLTLKAIIRNSHADLKVVAGCIFLLYGKACCVSVGIITALTEDVKPEKCGFSNAKPPCHYVTDRRL